ncbi:MAG TPA: hypothetical protein VNB06_13125 [Thermoanaerobaculia bacterium]|nr:hypothetical protein [Thermoanaerobaculia bacterium]
MGFFLEAFLGSESALRAWQRRLPAAVVCPLNGELALVPVTGALYRELRAVLGEKEAARLDAAQPPTWPSPSFVAAVRHWGAEASRAAPVAHLSTGEFGNYGHEEVTLWVGGREVRSRADLATALRFLRSEAGLSFDEAAVNVEKHRGEEAADKWVAEALRQDSSRGSGPVGSGGDVSGSRDGAGAETEEAGRSRRPLGGVLFSARRGGSPSGCVLTSCLAGLAAALAIWSTL